MRSPHPNDTHRVGERPAASRRRTFLAGGAVAAGVLLTATGLAACGTNSTQAAAPAASSSLVGGDAVATAVVAGGQALASGEFGVGLADHGSGAAQLGMPAQHAHHAAMMLVAPDRATHTAVADGGWSDPATWGGQVPGDSARVVIPEGRTVTVDTVLQTRIETVGVFGTLRVAPDVDTQLLVDTLVSSPAGLVEVGTKDRPIDDGVSARIRFLDDGPIGRSVDPEQLGRGAILHGTTVMYGAETTHRTTLVEFVPAGATTLRLAGELVGWDVGDQIVVTGTQGPTSDEVRTIAAIDGGTVTLDRPLELDHVPPRADLSVWVANTTRNVVVDSENREVARRGHVMFMHTHAVDVNHVLFDGLGRTDKSIPLDDVNFGDSAAEGGNEHDGTFEFGEANNIRARYSVHVHRGGTDPSTVPAYIQGSVVLDDPGWAFVNHSSNVDFIDNITYDAKGVGFMTEAGDEVGTMAGNIAIRSVMPSFTLDDEGAIDPDTRSDEQDFGFQGDGFWLQGNRVGLVDNVAAGASAHGIIFWSEGLIEMNADKSSAVNSMIDVSTLPDPSLITDRDQLHVWWAPLAEVRNNEAYASTVGFRSRYVHGGTYLGDEDPPSQAYIDSLDPVVDGLVVWDVRDGVLLNYNERLSLRNADIVGNGDPFDHNLFQTAAIGVGVDFGNEVTQGPGRVENVRVTGFELGVIAPRNGAWTMSDLYLANTTDLLIHGTREEFRTLDMTNIEFGALDGTAVAGREDARQHVVMQAWFAGLGEERKFLFSQDRITLDGQGLYFDIQAADAVPVTQERLDAVDPSDPNAGRDDEDDEAEFDEDEGREDEDDEFSEEDDGEFDEDEGRDEEEFDDEDDADEAEFDDEDGEDREDGEFSEEEDGDEGEFESFEVEPFIGKTNAELFAEFGSSFGGTMLPADAVRVSWLVGGVVGSPTPMENGLN